MAVKLTKNELKVQKDRLKQFQRYLPTLQLKKQQLQAVVMQAAPLYKTPSSNESPLRTLTAGTTVTMEESQPGGWCQVSLPDGRSGWLSGNALQAVRLGVDPKELDL